MYKPRANIFIADWLSGQNHKYGKITGIKTSTDVVHATVDIPECISLQDKYYLCTVNDHSKFPVFKITEGSQWTV